ncbi:MAG TPA: glycosyltransferase N-terminal domain-containing protein [bacterium]|nr:glycosyltransferase N-terminal domain-containing protein [bacterium]
MLFLAVYILLGLIAFPLALVVVAVGGLFKRDWWDDAMARFGRVPALAADRPIVVWCASVGEVNTAQRLIARLIEAAQAPVVVATYTPSGLRRARELFAGQATITLAPLDCLNCAARWVTRLRPRLLLLLETELWPLTLRIAADNGARLVMVNGRLSDRSFPRYRFLKFAVRPTLARFDLLCVQTEQFRQRFVQLGAPADRTVVTGSLKFDLTPGATPSEDATALYQAFCAERPVIVAGSTHEGEERTIGEALVALRKEFPDLAMIVAPRHVKRAGQALDDLTAAGCRVALRSQATAATARAADILLIDRIGELGWVFSLGRAAFVGGSFAPVGGHNVLEPAACGVPVLTGPLTPNFLAEVEALRVAGGIAVVADGPALIAKLRELLADEELRKRMGEAGRRTLEAHRGATTSTLERIWALPLERPPAVS